MMVTSGLAYNWSLVLEEDAHIHLVIYLTCFIDLEISRFQLPV